MSEGLIERKASKTARILVLILVLASAIAGLLLTTDLTSSQALSAAGQIVNQYSSNTEFTPSATVITYTSTPIPEFGFNGLWVLVGVIALLWSLLVLMRRRKPM
jgi:apolipoprotein N-acyltransferase